MQIPIIVYIIQNDIVCVINRTPIIVKFSNETGLSINGLEKNVKYLILSFTKFIIIIINISAERAYPKARTPQPNGPALPTSSGFLRPPTPCMGSSTFRLLIWDE